MAERLHYGVPIEVERVSSEPLMMRTDGGQSVKNYLLGLNADAEPDLARFLTREGNWRLGLNLDKCMEMSPDELARSLVGIFRPVYQSIDRELVDYKATGFNSHGEGHHWRCLKMAFRLAKQLKFTNQSEEKVFCNRMIISHLMHDLQMIQGRSANGLNADNFLALVFGDEARGSDNFLAIANAINSHSEDIASNIPAFANQDKLALMLQLTDKADIYRSRAAITGQKAIQLENDEHVMINAFVHSEAVMEFLTSSEGELSFSISFPFSRYDRKKEFNQTFHKNIASFKLKVPTWMKELSANRKLAYLFGLWGKLQEKYDVREAIMIGSVFALFPDMSNISLNVVDSDTHQAASYYRLTKDNWQLALGFNYYQNHRKDIMKALKGGENPEIPLIFGRHLLRELHSKLELNLGVHDDIINQY